jgi:hypothetical protein
MKRAWIVCVALAALAVPAVSSAAVSQTDYKNAAKFCKALRADMGAETFKQTFGTNKRKSNAHGKCVSKHARTLDEVDSDAVKNCRAEREADPVAFGNKYGTGKTKKNAFGKCVSQARSELKAEAADDIENAAKECKAERKADRAAFASKYGTNANKRNAFGKCVSRTVRENEQQPQS